MTRATTRTNFHCSSLIRVLTDLTLVDTGESNAAFAEKLSAWLTLDDDISLSAVLGIIPPVVSLQGNAAQIRAIADEFTRVRSLQVAAISRHSPGGGQSAIELLLPQQRTPVSVAPAYEPYRRYYLSHQREMELSIRPLRVNVRNVLASASPVLRQLAALDAKFDEILGFRESKVLAIIPSLLARHFDQLHNVHQNKLFDPLKADNPAAWMQAGGWLAQFCNDMQAVLLAELDIRLQPTVGLIEAFNNESTTQQ